ncbi:hypothetical protein HJD18_00520 [Thermoleophilia bacterium SCSIO 60948]|nr:hypothetical protein HJD18_00520 [Thermoleophilia bacterium SCSIO 60948]
MQSEGESLETPSPPVRHQWQKEIVVPEVPEGWTTGPPDFVGVGAQRGGTTWWYRGAIRPHPQVADPLGPRKEIHFFDRYFAEPAPPLAELAARYAELFPRAPGQIAGEWTPRYMSDFWALRMIREIAPEAKVLIMLRDPVERWRSGIGRDVRKAEREGYAGSAAVSGDNLLRSLYFEQVRRAFELFGRERVLVLQFEHALENTLSEMRRTHEFLGIEPLDELPKRLARDAPDSAKKPEIDPLLRTELVERLRGDVERLAELCPEIDVARWPDFG